MQHNHGRARRLRRVARWWVQGEGKRDSLNGARVEAANWADAAQGGAGGAKKQHSEDGG